MNTSPAKLQTRPALFSLFSYQAPTASALALLLLTATGCPTAPSPIATDGDPVQLPNASNEVLLDAWDVMLIEESKIGHVHTHAEKLSDPDNDRLAELWSAENFMSIQRSGQTSEQVVRYSTKLDSQGRLLSFESSRVDGGNESTTRGVVRGDKLNIEIKAAGQTEFIKLIFLPEYRGFFALERSLLTQPMQPGESRTLSALLPIFNTIGEIELRALSHENVFLLNGDESLLKIEEVVRVGDTEMKSVLWANEQGDVRKIYYPDGNYTGFRTTKERATKIEAGKPYDLGVDTMVDIEPPAMNLHDAQLATFKATLKRSNPVDVFPESAGQSIRSVNDREAVIRLGAQDGPIDSQPPSNADLAPSPLIQSEDARIKQLAAQAPAGATPLATAQQLESLIARTIEQKDFSTGFASAAEVAETLQGDCTEHSVLLAAVCRARDIPARVAVGLVYVPRYHAFAYHMWTEVWANDQWNPLDATLGQGGIGAGHLKLADSNLAGAGALAAFLPVVKVLNQLDLKLETLE